MVLQARELSIDGVGIDSVGIDGQDGVISPGQQLVLGNRRRLALAVLCLTLVIVSLDNTILNIALPTLVRVLKATNTQLEWIVDAYAVVSAGLLIFIGSLGDRFGRKRVLLIGLTVFASGSAGSAFSGSVAYLIASRATMGVGAACIMPATLAIITNLYRRQKERALAIGVWSGSEGFGIAMGPIAGGWLLAHYWWGSVFLINVPIAIVCAIGVVVLIPESSHRESSHSDWFGAALSIVGMSVLLWGIIESPIRGWHSNLVVMSAAFGIVVLTGFILWERSIDRPMLPLESFRNRRFSVAIASVALIIFTLMGILFVLTQYLQFSLGYSPFSAGLRILPVAAVLAVAAPLSTLLDRWLGSKVVVTAAMFCVGAGLLELATTSSSSTYGHALIGMIIVGAGAGLAFPPSTESIMGSLPRERTGVGSATSSSSLQLGGALGVAVVGSVLASRYQGRMSNLLAGHSVPAQALAAIKGSLGGALEVAHIAGGKTGELLAAGARISFLSGMDLGLKVGAAVAAASGIVALLLLPARPAKPLETHGIAFDRRATDIGGNRE